jgi:hypothetical protein
MRSGSVERFWARVDKSRGPSECWPWMGSRGRGKMGHGCAWWDGRSVSTHRLAWELTFGPIPAGEGYHGTCICHRCDNPPCCNPAHLFVGSNADNVRDRDLKGRTTHGRGKVTPEQVIEIRRRAALGESMRALGRAFGISHPAVSEIVSGATWRLLR